MIINISRDFVQEECINCGVVFLMGFTYHQHVKNSKATFYCPNGHSMSYTKSLSDKLKDEIDEKDKEIFQLRRERDEAIRKATKKKK